MDRANLRRTYDRCLEQKEGDTPATQNDIFLRLFLQLHEVISIGELLTSENNLPPGCVEYMRKAFKQVIEAFLDNSTSKLGEPLSTNDVSQMVQNIVKRAEVEAGDTGPENKSNDKEVAIPKKRKHRDESKCALEKASIFPLKPDGEDGDWTMKLANHMRAMDHDVNGTNSKALQELLLDIWSLAGAESVVAVVNHARHNTPSAHSTWALTVVRKDRSFSDFDDLTEAVARLLQVHSIIATTSAIDSVIIHATTARVLEEFMIKLRTGDGIFYEAYKTAISENKRLYGKKDTSESYKRFLLREAVPKIYEEEEYIWGSSVDGLYPGHNITAKDKVTIDRALKVGRVLFWLEEHFGSGVFAMLLHSPWEQLAFKAYDELRIPDILYHLSKASPSMGEISKWVYKDVWPHIIDSNLVDVRVDTLCYERMLEDEIDQSSIWELLAAC